MEKMKVEVKEKIVAVPSINDLPNEVLVTILEQLPFKLRLPMSVVCRRWNELVFNFFGDHIMLRLGENCGRSVGLLTNRAYRNIFVTWARKRAKWMTVVERMAPGLIYLGIIVEQWDEHSDSLWNPSDSKVDKLSHILGKLTALKQLYVEMSPKFFAMFSRNIFGLASLEVLSVVMIDTSRFHLSDFDFYLLPKLESLLIGNGTYFRLTHSNTPEPCPQVVDLTLKETFPSASLLLLSKVFPNLKELDIDEIAIKNKQLKTIVQAWPQLEVLKFGLCPTLLKSFTPEVLQQLPNLRKLVLDDVTNEDPKYDRRKDESYDFPNNYSLLEPIFRIPTLEELYIMDYYINWEGKLPKVAASGCRVYTKGQHHGFVRRV